MASFQAPLASTVSMLSERLQTRGFRTSGVSGAPATSSSCRTHDEDVDLRYVVKLVWLEDVNILLESFSNIFYVINHLSNSSSSAL